MGGSGVSADGSMGERLRASHPLARRSSTSGVPGQRARSASVGESELAGCAVAPMNRGRLALVRASLARDPCRRSPGPAYSHSSPASRHDFLRRAKLPQIRTADRPCDSSNTALMHALAARTPALLYRALCRQCHRSLATPARSKVFAGKPWQALQLENPALTRAATNS